MVAVEKLSIENKANHDLCFIDNRSHHVVRIHFILSLYEVDRGTGGEIRSQNFRSSKR